MFVLRIKFGKVWKIGIVTYNSYEEALERANELKSMKKGLRINIVDEFGERQAR